MKKKELKYVNSLKEENERIKNMLLQFVDAIGKLQNINDIVNISLIPLMNEENQKIRAEIKAEAVKEFVDLAIKTICEKVNAPSPSESYIVEKCIEVIDNLLKETVGNEK